MSTTVVQLETQLAAARADDQRRKRETAKKELKRLTDEGSRLRAELEPLVLQVRTAQDDRLRLHGELVKARNQINTYAAPLDPLTFPSDKDERERVRQLAAWKAKQQQFLAQHHTAVERESVRAYAGQLQRRLETLQYEIQNQMAVAEGRMTGEITGGAFIGIEDFLGNTQVGPPRHL